MGCEPYPPNEPDRMSASRPRHVVIGLGPVRRAVADELVGRGLPVRAVARHGVANLAAQITLIGARELEYPQGDSNP